MKKVFLGLSIAAWVCCSFGCNEDKKGSESASAASGSSEVVNTIEAKYQRNDASASDPNTALHCVYVKVQNNGGALSLSKAEVKTSGSCNWADLQGKAASAGMMSADASAQIVNMVASDTTLPANVREKWDCTAINITTNVRRVGVQDCLDNNGIANGMGKSIAGMLGL